MDDIIIHYPLAMRVLAVARVNPDVGDWAAYIDAVPGMSHKDEADEVARTGDKLPEKVAAALFPQIAERYEWRD